MLCLSETEGSSFFILGMSETEGSSFFILGNLPSGFGFAQPCCSAQNLILSDLFLSKSLQQEKLVWF